MGYEFRDAIASEAKPLIGLYAESGCGKTKSALLLAKGFTGDMSKVGMIETESGRGEAYANEPDIGGFKVLSLRETFSPRAYGAAISAAESAKMQALIIDSASHEWEGVGGVLAMAAANEEAGKKGPLVWQKPKIDHAREFMLRLTQTPIPLVIVCMRAKYPMYQISAKHVDAWDAAGRPGGKPPKVGEWARSALLEPKQSEDILYEMFVHGWISREDHAFHCTKYTIDSLRKVLVDGEPISIATGQRLAVWTGARAASAPAPSVDKPPIQQGSAVDKPADQQGSTDFITPDQCLALEARCQENGIELAKLKAAAKVTALSLIKPADLQRAHDWIEAVLKARRDREQQSAA